MTALESAERAVTDLSSDELRKFREWFAIYDGEVWDRQIEADAVAGRFDALAAEALRDYRAGDTTEI